MHQQRCFFAIDALTHADEPGRAVHVTAATHSEPAPDGIESEAGWTQLGEPAREISPCSRPPSLRGFALRGGNGC